MEPSLRASTLVGEGLTQTVRTSAVLGVGGKGSMRSYGVADNFQYSCYDPAYRAPSPSDRPAPPIGSTLSASSSSFATLSRSQSSPATLPRPEGTCLSCVLRLHVAILPLSHFHLHSCLSFLQALYPDFNLHSVPVPSLPRTLLHSHSLRYGIVPARPSSPHIHIVPQYILASNPKNRSNSLPYNSTMQSHTHTPTYMR